MPWCVSWLVVLAVGGTLMTGASRLRSGNHGAATLAWAPLCQKEFRKAPAFDMISTARPTSVPPCCRSSPLVGLLDVPADGLRSCRDEFAGEYDFGEGKAGRIVRIGELAGVGCREMHSCSSLIVCA